MTEETIDLHEYLKVLSKHKWLIIIGTLICLMTAVIATAYMSPVYEASIQLLVSQKQVVIGGGSSSAGEAYQAILTSERLAKTFSQMLKNRSTAEKVIEKLGVPISPTELTEKVKAEPVRDTQLIRVTVEDKNPSRAQLIANTLGVVFKKIVEDIEAGNNQQGNSSLISISVVEPAIEPLEPVKPRPLMNAMLALFVGLMASTGLAFLLNYLDTSIKEPDELEQLTGLISLGQIPTIQKNSDELIVKSEPRSLAAEAFRMLRTNIQYIDFESTLKTVIITSAGAGEGKTLFSSNFAAVMARAGHRVLVIGCDLRRPRIHQVFSASNDVGLANILIGTATIDKAIQKTEIEDLDIIASGPTPPNPVDLLESRRMKLFLEEAKQRYDFIILDSPPVSTITDALVLVAQTDGVIMLARHGVTNRQAFADAKAALEKVNARILGFVLNAASRSRAYGYYGYYYQKSYVEDKPASHSRKKWAKVLAAILLFGGIVTTDVIMDLGVTRMVFNVL